MNRFEQTPVFFNSVGMVLAFILLMGTYSAAAQEHTAENWTWNPVLAQALSDSGLVNKQIQIIQYGIAPGTVNTGAHRHPGELFVYVQEGAIEYRMGDQEPVLYEAGQVLYEPPYSLHTLFRNPSESQQAKLLLIFIATDGMPLSIREGTH